MVGELPPEQILKHLETGRMRPVYCFYGPDQFRMEMVLGRIRDQFLPESARDFNLKIFYGDDTRTSVADITDAACSLPFMASHRLILVRRTERFPAAALKGFLPYLENPSVTTCLIFVTNQANWNSVFFKRIREMGLSVHFRELQEREVLIWIRSTASGLGLTLTPEAEDYLYAVVGNRLTEINAEIQKLHLRHGDHPVGEREVRELVVHSRSFTIFEVIKEISLRKRVASLSVLERYLETEGQEAVLSIIGMLNRQIRLLFRTKSIAEGGGHAGDVAKGLPVPSFVARELMAQSQQWKSEELKRALELLYRADGLVKTGSEPYLTLQNVILSLTR